MMLSEWIDSYVEAKRNNDTKEMSWIERNLRKVGMDKGTLMILVTDAERKISNV